MEIYGPPVLNTILVGFLFGFGFAAGSWLWGALVGAVNRRRAEP
jgi:hypothetical protein